jgi:hypothetical protein
VGRRSVTEERIEEAKDVVNWDCKNICFEYSVAYFGQVVVAFQRVREALRHFEYEINVHTRLPCYMVSFAVSLVQIARIFDGFNITHSTKTQRVL